MSVTINVASTKNPTHHLSLSDGTTTVGLILPDGAQGIREIPYSPSTFKTSSGGTTYSDFEPPYAFEQQDTWEGGRGLENFRKDNTRFYDSANLWTMTPNSAFLAPQWSFGTDYGLAAQPMPGSVPWTSLAGERRHRLDCISAWSVLTRARSGISSSTAARSLERHSPTPVRPGNCSSMATTAPRTRTRETRHCSTMPRRAGRPMSGRTL